MSKDSARQESIRPANSVKAAEPLNSRGNEAAPDQEVSVTRAKPLAGLTALPPSAATVASHATIVKRAQSGARGQAGAALRQLQRQYGNHYVQRVVAQATAGGKDGAPVDDDEGLEREADVMGAKAVAGVLQAWAQSAKPDLAVPAIPRKHASKRAPTQAPNEGPSVQRKIIFTNLNNDDGSFFLRTMDRSVFADSLDTEEMYVLEKMATDDAKYEFEYSKTVAGKIVGMVKNTFAGFRAVKARVKKKIDANEKFELSYTQDQMLAIYLKAKKSSLIDRVVEDMIYTGSRIAKAIESEALIKQIDNWVGEVQRRGYPYRFESKEQFDQFKIDLLAAVANAGLPNNDVRIQGSSLRKPEAGDVDIAVFVSQIDFANLLRTRYSTKVKKNDAALDFSGKDYEALMIVAKDVVANSGAYNAQGRTFMNAMLNGIVSSKSDISMSLKRQREALANDYPDLNIESISVLIPGGEFELKPDMVIRQ